MDDLISRQAAIKALWLALYEYEDKCEKQFLESKELDVAEWFRHRIFVQNMSDIDRKTIFDLPTIYAVPVVRCQECKHSETASLNITGKNLGDLEKRHIRFCNYDLPSRIVEDIHFCSYGERKEDADRTASG